MVSLETLQMWLEIQWISSSSCKGVLMSSVQLVVETQLIFHQHKIVSANVTLTGLHEKLNTCTWWNKPHRHLVMPREQRQKGLLCYDVKIEWKGQLPGIEPGHLAWAASALTLSYDDQTNTICTVLCMHCTGGAECQLFCFSLFHFIKSLFSSWGIFFSWAFRTRHSFLYLTTASISIVLCLTKQFETVVLKN